MNLRHLGPLVIIAAVSLVLAAPPAAQAYDYTYARVVRLSLVDGDVQASRPDQQGWEPAVVNMPIQQGYSIATGQGRAEIEFENGATARLAENSVLQFTELALSGGGRITKLTLTQGTATFYANLSSGDSFVVLAPSLQVTIPEKASFRLDASNEANTVNVLKGEVTVDSRAGTSRLTKGHELTFRASEPERVALDRSPKPDTWDRWVADREEVIHTGSRGALRYVSSPYSYGLADLYSYGSWYNVGGYGQCWRPHGVGFGWAPFWNGRWAFYPGLGWTWISFEPWGWLPYHFGRWVFSPSLGWLWVPGGFHRHWHPGLVTWVRVRDHVGWVPLHPQDQPGATPTNLQHGVVVRSSNGFIGAQPNAPNGFIGARPNAQTGFIGAQPDTRITLRRGDAFEVLEAPPMDLPRRMTQAPAATVPTPPGGVSGAGRDSRTIVYDPKDRKFVNNPMGLARTEDRPRDTRADVEVRPAPRSPSATLPAPQTVPVQPPAQRGTPVIERAPAAGPTGPPVREREVMPRHTPPPPPARVDTPRPTTPAPPRAERPPARVSPPAAAPRVEPAPRPTPPPSAPRGEPRTPAAQRPRPE